MYDGVNWTSYTEIGGLPIGLVPKLLVAGYGVTVFPFIPGTAAGDGLAYRNSDELAAVGRMVADLHAAPVPATLPRDDLAIFDRASLESNLAALSDAWECGPYSEFE